MKRLGENIITGIRRLPARTGKNKVPDLSKIQKVESLDFPKAREIVDKAFNDAPKPEIYVARVALTEAYVEYLTAVFIYNEGIFENGMKSSSLSSDITKTLKNFNDRYRDLKTFHGKGRMANKDLKSIERQFLYNGVDVSELKKFRVGLNPQDLLSKGVNEQGLLR